MLYQILVYALDHDPEVYDRTADNEASAIADAIEVKVIRKVDEQAESLDTHDVVTVALGPLLPYLTDSPVRGASTARRESTSRSGGGFGRLLAGDPWCCFAGLASRFGSAARG
jgi:hypothetical protein